MATEYLSGGDLSHYLHYKKKHFTELEAKFIVANIILGLEFLHNNGVLHRDVQPSNLIFDA